MEKFGFWDARAKITKRDVEELKKNLRIGDTVWVEIETEEFIGGALRKKVVYKKRRVVKKYRNLVEVQTGSSRRLTLTYIDILVNDLKRKRKADEGSME